MRQPVKDGDFLIGIRKVLRDDGDPFAKFHSYKLTTDYMGATRLVRMLVSEELRVDLANIRLRARRMAQQEEGQ